MADSNNQPTKPSSPQAAGLQRPKRWESFLLGAAGGLAPIFAIWATTNSPESMGVDAYLQAGKIAQLIAASLLGGVVALCWGVFTYRDAFAIGIAAPALVGNVDPSSISLISPAFPAEHPTTYSRNHDPNYLIHRIDDFGTYLRLNGIGSRSNSERQIIELRSKQWFVLEGPIERFKRGFFNIPFKIDGNFVQRYGTKARDVGVGANNSVWVIGTNSASGGFGIWKWTGRTFIQGSGGATRIDVGPDGAPWVVNNQGTIYRGNAQSASWTRIPGKANDIGVGANGTVFVIGTNRRSGGFGVWKLQRNGSFEEYGGGAVRIDVAPNGDPWVVNDKGVIYRGDMRSNDRWQKLPGRARDIAVGATGQAWVIGTNNETGGFGIWTWTGGNWTKVRGGGTQISAGKEGFPWVVNQDGQVYQWISP